MVVVVAANRIDNRRAPGRPGAAKVQASVVRPIALGNHPADGGKRALWLVGAGPEVGKNGRIAVGIFGRIGEYAVHVVYPIVAVTYSRLPREGHTDVINGVGCGPKTLCRRRH